MLTISYTMGNTIPSLFQNCVGRPSVTGFQFFFLPYLGCTKVVSIYNKIVCELGQEVNTSRTRSEDLESCVDHDALEKRMKKVMAMKMGFKTWTKRSVKFMDDHAVPVPLLGCSRNLYYTVGISGDPVANHWILMRYISRRAGMLFPCFMHICIPIFSMRVTSDARMTSHLTHYSIGIIIIMRFSEDLIRLKCDFLLCTWWTIAIASIQSSTWVDGN